MTDIEIIINWLLTNAYGAIGEEYWVLRDFPVDRTPERFHIPIAPNTKIWRYIKQALQEQKQ